MPYSYVCLMFLVKKHPYIYLTSKLTMSLYPCRFFMGFFLHCVENSNNVHKMKNGKVETLIKEPTT